MSITGGSVKKNIYGGTGGDGGHAHENTVTINSGTVEGDIYGGRGGQGGQGDGGRIDGGAGGDGGGGGHAYKNVVSITGGTVKKNIYGGTGGEGYYSSDGMNAGSGGNGGNAHSNTVVIKGGRVNTNVCGGGGGGGGAGGDGLGNANRAGDGGGGGHAYKNVVSITGGSVGGNIYGGTGGTGSIGGTGHTSGDGGTGGDATYNIVTITGGFVGGNIYGGTGGDGGKGGSGGDGGTGGDATYNTVTLGGSLVLENTNIYGGQGGTGGRGGTGGLPGIDGDSFTGNTLNLHNYRHNSASTIQTIKNFQNYSFILPSTLQNGDTLIKAQTVQFGNDDGTKKSTITGLALAGSSSLGNGDTVTLIDATISGDLTNEVNGAGEAFAMSGQKGFSLFYDFELVKLRDALTATVTGARLNPQTKALSEGRVANMAFVNQGADLIAGQGLTSALASAKDDRSWSAFAAASGGTSRYDSGSHVDVDGFSIMTGLAWNAELDYGKLLLGAFFEAGWGSYDSHNSFSSYASVKGDGDTEYYGGGLLGRFDFAYSDLGNWYTEASVRAGWTETDFESSDLRDPITGKKADYDSGSAYYGVHAGLGYIFQLSDCANLDVYTKYFWTHQEGDSVRVSGDKVRFDSADSHRWRGGARFDYTLEADNGAKFIPYVGAAYEYEFDSKARARLHGYSLDEPDIEGGTGMGELGLSFKPAADSVLSLDLGVQGYTGKREGVSGNFMAKIEF